MSHVRCHMSGVRCHMSGIIFFGGLDIWWRVCNQQGLPCFQHLKNVIGPWIELHSYLAAKPNMVSNKYFAKRESFYYYLLYDTLATYVSYVAAMVSKLPCRYIFGGFCTFWVTSSPAKITPKLSLQCNWEFIGTNEPSEPASITYEN